MSSIIPKISNIGQRVDFEIRQGSTFYPTKHTLTNPDGTPVNLTGCTVRGHIRKTARSAGNPVAAFAITYAPNRTDGWYTFGLSKDQTAAFSCGTSMAAPESQYVHDIELVDSSGNVMELIYGVVRVQAGVTHG